MQNIKIMNANRNKHLGKTGIYCIKNFINNKVYIGKAKCIYSRIKDHITRLNTGNKDENILLIRAWHKYGRENFKYTVLEYLSELDEDLLRERELYWIDFYQSLNRDKGYNLRYDSKTGLIISQETRERLSIAQSNRFESLEERRKVTHDYWTKNWQRMVQIKKDNPIVYYKFEQYDKHTKQLVKVWNNIIELIEANPTYKKHNIYAVVSGEKPSMYGYIWKKVLIK